MKVNTLNTQSNSPSFGSEILIDLCYLAPEKATKIREAVLEEIGYGIKKYPYTGKGQGLNNKIYYQDVFVGNIRTKNQNDIMIATGSENRFLKQLGYTPGYKQAEAKLKQVDDIILEKVKEILKRFVAFIDNEMIINNVDFYRASSNYFGIINERKQGLVEIVKVIDGSRYSEFFTKQEDGTYLHLATYNRPKNS